MKPAFETELRARATMKIDLRSITHEQAVYAILDRAALWAEREQRQIFDPWLWLLGAGVVTSMGLYVLRSAWPIPYLLIAAPLAISALIYGIITLRKLSALAAEAQAARADRNLTEAIVAIQVPESAPEIPVPPASPAEAVPPSPPAIEVPPATPTVSEQAPMQTAPTAVAVVPPPPLLR